MMGRMPMILAGASLWFVSPVSHAHARHFTDASTAVHADARLQGKLARLTFFVGHWSCAGKFASGKAISSRETFAPVLSGHWLRMHHADHPPHHYAAVEMWHFDQGTGHFRVHVFDNSGGQRQYVASGWKSDELVLRNVATHGYVDRFVFRRQDRDAYQVVYAHRLASGAWEQGDALQCRRVE